MSTRCNVIIKDSYDEIMYYRHLDGYPAGALPTLCKFMQYRKENRIRNNAEQSAGWLILIGAKEYDTIYDFKTGTENKKEDLSVPGNDVNISGWKCGAYEPCLKLHGDIEYLYILNIEKDLSIEVFSVWHKYNKDYTKSTFHKKKLGIITDFYKEYDNYLEEVS